MTSMPASRRARAITLAPRSWPSSPGLATSTRILRSSAIEPFIKPQTRLLTTEDTENTEAKASPQRSQKDHEGILKNFMSLGCVDVQGKYPGHSQRRIPIFVWSGEGS